jgi:membrane protein involved in colicin uptake
VKNRYFLLGGTIVLALSLAVPALGGPSNPIASVSASAKKTANRALRAAAAAQDTANKAQTTANTALTTANTAKTTADKAQVDATAAKAAAAAAQATADSKLGTPTTNSGDTSASNATDSKQIISTCPAAQPKLLSGGYIMTGAATNDLTATVNSPYGNQWITTVEEGDAVATNWGVTGLIQCAS